MLVSRDPFAREEIHKEITNDLAGGCSWCGNTSKLKSGKERLWKYSVERDYSYSSKSPIAGKFCCNSCFNIYHNR